MFRVETSTWVGRQQRLMMALSSFCPPRLKQQIIHNLAGIFPVLITFPRCSLLKIGLTRVSVPLSRYEQRIMYNDLPMFNRVL